MIPLRWIGATLDTSGYASATRGYIRGLLASKQVDLSVGTVTFEQQKTSHGDFLDLVKPHADKDIEFDIQITHLTPENFPAVRHPDAYNVGYTVWETDRLPHSWVELCNMMDEIWVPSTWNVEVFRSSGVTKHIHVVPHIITPPSEDEIIDPVSMGVDTDTFVFYSIFQWIERKNPIALLKAYLTEFTPADNVCLALKTYRINTSVKEQQLIKKEIGCIKKALNMPTEFPPIRFFGQLLTAEQMAGFHQRGDCFVLAHRGEGFGIPHAEAMSRAKPVIASNYSGNLEFMDSGNSYLIDCHKTPVCNMIFPNYFGYMNWSEPSVGHLRELMREVYSHREAARKVGEKGRQSVSELLSTETITQNIVGRLQQIQEKLNG